MKKLCRSTQADIFHNSSKSVGLRQIHKEDKVTNDIFILKNYALFYFFKKMLNPGIGLKLGF